MIKYIYRPFLVIITLALLAIVSGSEQRALAKQSGPEGEGDGLVEYEWTRDLPADSCPGGGNSNCHYSSPALADINGDGRLDVIAATNNGHVVARNHIGQLLWDRDVAPAFGMAPGTHEIASSPAVADIDDDGYMEVIVGTGTIFPFVCTQGGVIVLNHNGQVEPGWPQLSADFAIEPSGCRDTIFGSPAVGDMDNDGDLEIAVGGFDKSIYAWHHNGQPLPGFPPDSVHRSQFPNWNYPPGHLFDTIWSSPAMADLDGDGYLDIIIGTDEGDVGGGWTCPYRLPPGWIPGYCGGSIYALNRFGELLPGFPRFIHETIQSTPAIADINADGLPEIIVGTGNFYYNHSPDHPTDGFRLYVFDREGRDFPGWEGGRPVQGTVPASPAVGDITGDGAPEIVVASSLPEKRVYAWYANGAVVPGFPMTARDHFGQNISDYNVGTSFALADVDGDDKMEIIFNQGWVVSMVDGNGAQLTAEHYPPGYRPLYLTDGSLMNAPAVADIDNDGKLELVAQNSKLYVWEIAASTANAEWGMFKQNAAGTGFLPPPIGLSVSHEELVLYHNIRGGNMAVTYLTIRSVSGHTLSWNATAPSDVSLTPHNGSLSVPVRIKVRVSTSGYGRGSHNLGNIVVHATKDGDPVMNSPASVAVRLHVGDWEPMFLPLIGR